MSDGVLVIDKPAGPTSFQVVARVRRALGAVKAGHTGTLDPMATGVLAVCLGEAVKLQQFLAEGDKEYEAAVAFGAATDTEDAEGEVVARSDPSRLSAEAVAAALPRFRGEISQVPPMYSAVKVGGRRLHRAARRGEIVERGPRRVTVHALDLIGFEAASGGLARARLAVRCGKGTYVRSLAAALGAALGVPAHLAGLRRTRAGPFGLGTAVALEEAERLARRDHTALEARIVPAADALPGPRMVLDAGQARALRHGMALRLPTPEGLVGVLGPEGGLVGALGPDGGLVAVCRAERGELKPIRVLSESARR